MSSAVALPPTSPLHQLDTLPAGVPDDHGIRTLGWVAAKWAESLLIQPNGPRAGKPFKFTKRQLRFLAWWYAVDDDGRWIYTHAVRRLSKGAGKSPSAAVLALIEFCGPVRLERFDSRLPGGCRGKPVEMPLVQIAATAESQTKNTMRMVRAFAPKNSPIVREYGLDPGKTQYYKVPEGTLEVITSSFTAAEGAESSFCVGDETEHWRPANNGPELMSTLQDNLSKNGNRLLETANAWVPGQETVAESSWDAWVAQEEGRTRGETKILYDAVIAPPETDMSDPASLRPALELIYADCDWKKPHGPDGEPIPGSKPDVRPMMERIWSPKSKPSDSKRKYLNWPSASEDAWVTPEQWRWLAEPTTVVADGDDVALFFDGSKSRDGTALIGCRVEDGHVFELGVWEPDPSHDSDETVDVAAVDLAVRQAFDRFSVVAFFSDVREWESFALTEWPSRYKDDLLVWAAPKARPPQPVAWDMRSHTYEFAKAAEACHEEILEGAFTHDGASATARHVANARRRPYRDAVSVGKASPDSRQKVDAAVCVIGVRMVRRIVLADPKYTKRRKRTGKASFIM